MYSGTTFTPMSGNILGAHQKLDRVARKHLERLLDDNSVFPKSRKIVHFEGNKGPDAIKRKSPAQDEPWHYYSPFNKDDSQLIELIHDHYQRLVKELKAGNEERTAFEAAWLAHALVDGLTPAHHYPYEETLKELRGEGIESRDTIKKKLIISGDTRREKFKNNWKIWGGNGLITSHIAFELGIAAILAPLTMSESVPKERDIKIIQEVGIKEWFKRTAREIAILDMYGRYRKKGWTPKLAYDIRHKLGPSIAKTVCLAWYMALIDAKLVTPEV
jgi:hypothetical protein